MAARTNAMNTTWNVDLLRTRFDTCPRSSGSSAVAMSPSTSVFLLVWGLSDILKVQNRQVET